LIRRVNSRESSTAKGIVLTTTDLTFASLGLAEPLQRALDGESYTTPTPIQAQAIPVLLQGRDLLGIAQTGTGKTAAFALPILHSLTVNRVGAGPRGVRALVLAPTRELAIQIAESFRRYGRHLAIRQAVVFGGVGHRPQMDAMARGVDVLIATPGRLLDLMGTGHVKLDRLTHLVLDEADRMLDMGFIKDVRRIVSHVPANRQSMLFSATMPTDVARLAADLLRDPTRVEVAPVATTVERIEQRVYHIEASRKRTLLTDLLSDGALSRVIVFTRTKHGADRVAEHLDRAGVNAEAIHGNKSQNQRQRTLASFHAGKVRVLVATDIASRGIDVDNISHVINYELPHEPDSYVHRIGRTARAGATGIAISLCDHAERANLRAIEKLIRLKLTVIGEEPAGNQRGAAANDEGAPERPRSHRGQAPRNQGGHRGPRHEGGPRHDGPRHQGPNRGRNEGQRSSPRQDGPSFRDSDFRARDFREEAPRGPRQDGNRQDNHQGAPRPDGQAPARDGYRVQGPGRGHGQKHGSPNHGGQNHAGQNRGPRNQGGQGGDQPPRGRRAA
jgi:ATP-dependent RNA helicase RhlE